MILCVVISVSIVVVTIFTKWLIGKQTVGNYGNRYVLITGCNSGFGNLLAKRLDSLGFNVFAACHSDNGVEELEAATSNRLVTFKLEIADEGSIREAVEFVKSRIPVGCGLWALINNSGTAASLGPVDWLQRQDYAHALSVNLLGLVDITRSFLPLLREGQGRVINMSSILTKVGMGPSPYVVSKYAVEGFSDCLRLELFRQGVSVIVLQPGFYRTNFLPIETMMVKYKQSFAHAHQDVQAFYGEEYLDKALKHCHDIDSLTSSDLSQVTRAYVHAVTARFPRARYIVGRDANIVFRVLWNLPLWMKDRLLTFNYIQPEGTTTPRDGGTPS
ncbi:retinol dehydrogenase 16-like [Haliotis rufescens]|uniref:retinol dehydrogenase 16-like n=1 Tax=Haliotis rufescens TaxID=6454 RepID=UPI001EB066F6|nr:retinol dehydrogenase 16-like [Haliotis rufescens]